MKYSNVYCKIVLQKWRGATLVCSGQDAEFEAAIHTLYVCHQDEIQKTELECDT